MRIHETKHLKYKFHKKTDVTNYSPISLIITIAKILEKVIYTWVSQHQIHSGVGLLRYFDIEQFGFQKYSYTNTAVYSLTHNIGKALNKYKQIVGIFCDTAKAFDSVNHILLDKLCYYGIHGSALLWFRFYLGNRRQRDEVLHNECGKTSSGWETIKKGRTPEIRSWPTAVFTIQQWFTIRLKYWFQTIIIRRRYQCTNLKPW